jgi:hypothetical protein
MAAAAAAAAGTITSTFPTSIGSVLTVSASASTSEAIQSVKQTYDQPPTYPRKSQFTSSSSLSTEELESF